MNFDKVSAPTSSINRVARAILVVANKDLKFFYYGLNLCSILGN